MKFNQKKENLKSVERRKLQIGKNSLLSVVDWFEVRVNSLPSINKLNELGYSEELDKGCATHYNYFETDKFSIAWNIKSSYIKQVYTHVRFKNDYLYTLDVRKFGCGYVMTKFLECIFEGDYVAYVSRLDICFDIQKDSELVDYLTNLFITKSLVSGITRYGSISGVVQKTGEKYVNYYAGNRSSFAFYRLYDKYIENTDKNGVVKKQYIDELHKTYFGTNRVMRFEVEIKPNNCLLSKFQHDNFYYDFIKSRFFGANVVVQPYFGNEYYFNDTFSPKDAYNLNFLIKKFMRFFGDDFGLSFDSVLFFLDKLLKNY